MWSSTDGKGRSKYPMAAVAHFGLPFSYTLAARAARVLADVEARCKQATTAPEVRAVFATRLGGTACGVGPAAGQPRRGAGPGRLLTGCPRDVAGSRRDVSPRALRFARKGTQRQPHPESLQ